MAVSEDRLYEALIEAAGNQSAAARAVGIKPQAVWARIQKSERLNEALNLGLLLMEGEAHDVIREGMARRERVPITYKDGKPTEYELLDEPDKVAVDTAKWALARLNKGRWSERQEITGADGGAVKIEVEYVNDSADAPQTP